VEIFSAKIYINVPTCISNTALEFDLSHRSNRELSMAGLKTIWKICPKELELRVETSLKRTQGSS
jgi:hypothetical protein